jgi:hypothetical protein
MLYKTRRASAAIAAAWVTVRPMSDMPLTARDAGAATGSVLVGLPLTLTAASAMGGTGRGSRLALIWVVLVAIYGLAAYRLRRR